MALFHRVLLLVGSLLLIVRSAVQAAEETTVAAKTMNNAEQQEEHDFHIYSTCLDKTVDFLKTVNGGKGGVLLNPFEEDSENEEDVYDIQMDIESKTITIAIYSPETTKKMMVACQEVKGAWVSFGGIYNDRDRAMFGNKDPEKLTCAVFGNPHEQLTAVVGEYGHCLARVEECRAPHTLRKILLSKLAQQDMVCYGYGESPPPNFESIVKEVDKYFGRDDDHTTVGESLLTSLLDGGLFLSDEKLQSIGLSNEDRVCLVDTQEAMAKSEKLQIAFEDYSANGNFDMENWTPDKKSGGAMAGDLGFGYSKEALTKYETACANNGGRFVLLPLPHEFVCREKWTIHPPDSPAAASQPSPTTHMTLTNMGHCLVDTNECHSMNTVNLLQHVWNQLGLVCDYAGPILPSKAKTQPQAQSVSTASAAAMPEIATVTATATTPEEQQSIETTTAGVESDSSSSPETVSALAMPAEASSKPAEEESAPAAAAAAAAAPVDEKEDRIKPSHESNTVKSSSNYFVWTALLGVVCFGLFSFWVGYRMYRMQCWKAGKNKNKTLEDDNTNLWSCYRDAPAQLQKPNVYNNSIKKNNKKEEETYDVI